MSKIKPLDLNELEEVKWEFCIKVIDYYLYNAVPMRSDTRKYLTELKEDLLTFLKEQE